MYKAIFYYGGISDASIYSILDDKSNYGTDKANQTADRGLSISLPVKALPEGVKGDANGDGIVNAADIVEIINGKITDSDIDDVVKIILGKAQ